MRLLTLLLALPALPACVLDFEFDDFGSSREALAVDDAYVEGDLGDVNGVSAEARVVSAYESFGHVDVELRAQGRGWAVMHMLDLETDQLRAGDVYDSDDRTSYVSVLGCSGPSDGQWTYDDFADRVVVEVEQGDEPTKLRVHYYAEYERYGERTQVVRGSFDVRQ